METTQADRRYVSDNEVRRIPWREFIRNQFRKIIGFAVLLTILAIIINLSSQISPDPKIANPQDIIDLTSRAHLYLIILSSLLFLLVLGVFTKVVLVDHREEFGVTNWKEPRMIITFLLTTSFISLVYILLDVSLINIYLMTLPTWVVWIGRSIHPALEAIIPETTDRVAYSAIRGELFIALLTFLFIFPVFMFISIFTRLGRNTIKKRREQEKKFPMTKLLAGLIISGILTIVIYILSTQIDNEVVSAVLFFVVLGFGLSDVIFVLLIIFNLIRFTVFLTYSNFLLIFPFIFMFYLLPGALWGLWDLIYILTNDGITSNTIYHLLPQASYGMDPTTLDITALAPVDIFRFYLQTVLLNLRPIAILRIIELDFIIIIGLSAIVIGFAEGYSILAILRSIAKGVSIAKTGKVASESAPKIIVITSRLFYLGAWLTLIWDYLIVIAKSLSSSINISIPIVEFPNVLQYVVELSDQIASLGKFLVVFTVLAVPFYFILTSSFKFLSVSLILERVREDKQLYYLLISSAFVLIVTNIFADIAALPQFIGREYLLPLSGNTTKDLLPFVAKIFEILESFAFYAGVGATIVVSIQNAIQGSEEEIQETTTSTQEETSESDSSIPEGSTDSAKIPLVDQLESENELDQDDTEEDRTELQ